MVEKNPSQSLLPGITGILMIVALTLMAMALKNLANPGLRRRAVRHASIGISIGILATMTLVGFNFRILTLGIVLGLAYMGAEVAASAMHKCPLALGIIFMQLLIGLAALTICASLLADADVVHVNRSLVFRIAMALALAAAGSSVAMAIMNGSSLIRGKPLNLVSPGMSNIIMVMIDVVLVLALVGSVRAREPGLGAWCLATVLGSSILYGIFMGINLRPGEAIPMAALFTYAPSWCVALLGILLQNAFLVLCGGLLVSRAVITSPIISAQHRTKIWDLLHYDEWGLSSWSRVPRLPPDAMTPMEVGFVVLSSSRVLLLVHPHEFYRYQVEICDIYWMLGAHCGKSVKFGFVGTDHSGYQSTVDRFGIPPNDVIDAADISGARVDGYDLILVFCGSGGWEMTTGVGREKMIVFVGLAGAGVSETGGLASSTAKPRFVIGEYGQALLELSASIGTCGGAGGCIGSGEAGLGSEWEWCSHISKPVGLAKTGSRVLRVGIIGEPGGPTGLTPIHASKLAHLNIQIETLASKDLLEPMPGWTFDPKAYAMFVCRHGLSPNILRMLGSQPIVTIRDDADCVLSGSSANILALERLPWTGTGGIGASGGKLTLANPLEVFGPFDAHRGELFIRGSHALVSSLLKLDPPYFAQDTRETMVVVIGVSAWGLGAAWCGLRAGYSVKCLDHLASEESKAYGRLIERLGGKVIDVGEPLSSGSSIALIRENLGDARVALCGVHRSDGEALLPQNMLNILPRGSIYVQLESDWMRKSTTESRAAMPYYSMEQMEGGIELMVCGRTEERSRYAAAALYSYYMGNILSEMLNASAVDGRSTSSLWTALSERARLADSNDSGGSASTGGEDVVAVAAGPAPPLKSLVSPEVRFYLVIGLAAILFSILGALAARRPTAIVLIAALGGSIGYLAIPGSGVGIHSIAVAMTMVSGGLIMASMLTFASNIYTWSTGLGIMAALLAATGCLHGYRVSLCSVGQQLRLKSS